MCQIEDECFSSRRVRDKPNNHIPHDLFQDTIRESLLDFLWKSKTPSKALWSLRSIDLRVIALYPFL